MHLRTKNTLVSSFTTWLIFLYYFHSIILISYSWRSLKHLCIQINFTLTFRKLCFDFFDRFDFFKMNLSNRSTFLNGIIEAKSIKHFRLMVIRKTFLTIDSFKLFSLPCMIVRGLDINVVQYLVFVFVYTFVCL